MEILVQLIPKSINLEGRIQGGVPELTTADISACLAGCDDIGLMILFRRVTDDTSAHTGAYKRLCKAVYRLIDQEGWKIAKSDQKLTNLINLCLLEYITPLKCPTCQGTGMYRYKECGTCKGTTNYVLNDSQRSYLIGVHRSNWKRNWSEKHRQLTDFFSLILPDHEYRAVRKAYKRLIERR